MQGSSLVALEDMSILTDKQVKKTEMTPEEVARYEGYMNDPEMHGIRQQMEVDLRKADAEHAAAEGRAKDAAAETARRDQRDAGPDKSKQRDPEPGTLPAVASAKAPEASRLIDPGMINTDNLTLADLQKIHEMARSYIGLAMDKAEKVEQAQKMLAYLKSQLPSDKANQVFQVLAEKGIFNRNLLASAGSVAGLGAGVVITIETLGSIALAPKIAIGALIAGGVYI